MKISENKFQQTGALKTPKTTGQEDPFKGITEDSVTFDGNDTMKVSFPPSKKELEELFQGEGTEESKLGSSDPCSTGVRSMNDPCFASVQSMNDPCKISLQSMNDPCKVSIKSMNDPCHIGIRSMNDPCSMGIRSASDPCSFGIRSSHGGCSIGLR